MSSEQSRRLVHTVAEAPLKVEATGYYDGRAFVALGDVLLRPEEARALATSLATAAGLSESLSRELAAAGPTLRPLGLRGLVEAVREAEARAVEHEKAKKREPPRKR